MSSHLCLSVTFLDRAFHGRADAGEVEWPPSPLRLYQALVAACAARWPGPQFDEVIAPALDWLETLPPPLILAPRHHVGIPTRLAVPNNDSDILAKAWAKGQEPKKQLSELKTLKTVRPTYLRGADSVHYLYALPDPMPHGGADFIAILACAARSLTHLGWGVDMVAGHGRLIEDGSADDPRRDPYLETWRPSAESAGSGSSVPTPGTLADLRIRFQGFLDRLSGGAYHPVPTLTAFRTVAYHRPTDLAPRPFAAFEIWKPLAQLADLRAGQSRLRPFDTTRRALTVAGMVRCALALAADAHRDPAWINTFVHGHSTDGTAQASGEGADQRLAYLPLPSITPLKVESIRRVLVLAPAGEEASRDWVRQVLSGRELFSEEQTDPVAMLSPMSGSDPNLRLYKDASEVWTTVTPVILPGRYTKGPGRARRLMCSAFRQAGCPAELVESAQIDWREVGYRPGVDLASRYRVAASQSALPRYHVRVRFAKAVSGPLAVGAGRYRGLGLFASEG